MCKKYGKVVFPGKGSLLGWLKLRTKKHRLAAYVARLIKSASKFELIFTKKRCLAVSSFREFYFTCSYCGRHLI